MNDKGAKYLAAAVALWAAAFFSTHLHVVVPTSGGSSLAGLYVVTNALTGESRFCSASQCWHAEVK
jgi:hypothetical protein